MTDESYWNAVVQRDADADGTFVYAVRTTRIYCHPSCPSKRPLQKNVIFFSGPAEAVAAGYRACKRCHPDETGHRSDGSLEVVKKACALLEHDDNTLTLAQLAKQLGVTPHRLHRAFKRITGLTPKSYAAELRASRIRNGLINKQKVTDAIYEAGYGAPSRFYEEAHRRLGMAATAYRDGGPGTRIWFAVADTALGPLAVAATEQGICSMEFGDDPEDLVHSLQDRFPKAVFVGADERFEHLVARICAHVHRPIASLELPLDVQGTAFQQKVWAELRKIPIGETRTYGEIATAIGVPKAQRAVARACASNPAAVAIPCHRVVRTDGSLSGYRWGIERKARLLARESDP